jgi:hypothetical protein
MQMGRVVYRIAYERRRWCSVHEAELKERLSEVPEHQPLPTPVCLDFSLSLSPLVVWFDVGSLWMSGCAARRPATPTNSSHPSASRLRRA